MTASFTAAGHLDLITGLAIMLGANIGTTLIVKVLSFNRSAAAPALSLMSGTLYWIRL